MTGTYNSNPDQTGFFSDSGSDNYRSPYGQFFLGELFKSVQRAYSCVGWYSEKLLQHGEAILSAASNIFRRYPNVGIAAKVSGIHWWYVVFIPIKCCSLEFIWSKIGLSS